MPADSHAFLQTLCFVLGTAAITTVLFQKIRQPVILGYLLAGMIISPQIPIPLEANAEIVHTLAELGMILLLFSLGLEFSLRKLLSVLPTAGFIAFLQCSLMIWLGYAAGRLFGWTSMESLYAGAIIAISSTTIIVKAFAEQGVEGKIRDLVFGVLIVEDLIAILLLTVFNTISSGASFSSDNFFRMTGGLTLFLLITLAGGIFIVPRLIRMIVRLNRPETTLVAGIGICFGLAYVAHVAGYSVALGAFLGGALIAESGESPTMEHLVQPVRDMFGAIFFVAVGMMIDPALIAEHWGAVLAFLAIVVLGKLFSVSLGAFLIGHTVRTSVKSGMSLAQIGEFSFIIAGVGLASGATREFLYPVAVAVSALSTLLTPWLIRASDPFAKAFESRLPQPIQTFTTLYTSWIEQLKAAFTKEKPLSRMRRLLGLLFLDTFLCGLIIILVSIYRVELLRRMKAHLDLSKGFLTGLLIAATLIALLPFLIGIFRCARGIGARFAMQILPNAEKGALDTAAAPRRALLVTFQLLVTLIVGLLLLMVTQPFVPLGWSASAFGAYLFISAIVFWRSADNLQGHVRAGAQMIVETLSSGMKTSPEASIEKLLPGLGSIVPVTLKAGSFAVGKTLKDLHLRALTGANAVAIVRGTGSIAIPTGREQLLEGDVIALTGTPEATKSAEVILIG